MECPHLRQHAPESAWRRAINEGFPDAVQMYYHDLLDFDRCQSELIDRIRRMREPHAIQQLRGNWLLYLDWDQLQYVTEEQMMYLSEPQLLILEQIKNDSLNNDNPNRRRYK